jgi:outer membrane lipoprotein SlyB
MSIGGMGALAGGLAGGYFQGEDAQNRRGYCQLTVGIDDENRRRYKDE